MPEHTPGPWEYHEKLSGSENHKGFYVRSKKGWWLADVSPLSLKGEVSEEGKANARLIAAAPDLLEALKGCMRVIDSDPRWQYEDQYPDEWFEAKKAIAKATGK